MILQLRIMSVLLAVPVCQPLSSISSWYFLIGVQLKQMPFFLAGYEDSKPLGCLQFTWSIPDRLSGRRRFCAVNPELRQRRRMRRDGFATLTHQKYRRRARSTEANPKTKCDLLKQVAFCFGSGRRIRIRNQLFLWVKCSKMTGFRKEISSKS